MVEQVAIRLKCTLKVDGEYLAPGQVVHVSADEADRLLAAGLAEKRSMGALARYPTKRGHRWLRLRCDYQDVVTGRRIPAGATVNLPDHTAEEMILGGRAEPLFPV